jgi:5-methyltetrahydropteroyltriglutamate--homocysteine methyltransferase
MRRSVDRFLTTHTGSLPRPPELTRLLMARERGEADAAALAAPVREAVAGIVAKQAQAGVDVVNDGEMSKASYSGYVRDRLTGFEGEGEQVPIADFLEYPEYAQRWVQQNATEAGEFLNQPACVGEIRVKDPEAVATDIANLQAALSSLPAGAVQEAFVTAAAPGVVGVFFGNHHYPSREAYLGAIGDAMRPEYEAIAGAGLLLQLDCPDLALGRHCQFPGLSLEEFRREARLSVQALNDATASIDPDQMRMHLCWGNYEGPHHLDVELEDIIDIVLEARPNGISIEACNPRHEHEWAVFENVKLPAGKVLIPGVIDSTNNYIEHPELIAQRLLRYARLVGRENVIGGSDCGFATAAGILTVDPAITWAKLEAMRRGAALADGKAEAAAV